MSLIHFSGAPWLQSSTSSASGQRVLRSRDFRSLRTASGTAMQNGVTALMEAASLFFGLQHREDAVRLGAPIRAAGEFLGALCAEQAVIGEVGDPGLPLGRALRGPRRQPSLAHGLGDFAHFLGAAAAVLDYALEEIGALLFPIDAGIGFLQRSEHCVLDAIGARGRKTL